MRFSHLLRRLRRLPVLLALGATAAVLIPEPASAHEDTLFGVRGGYYTQEEQPFVGVELLVPLAHSFYANPNVEYIFGNGRTYMTFNMDFHYDFYSHSSAFVWVGGGLGVLYRNPEGPGPSSTDVGANFLAGVGLSRHRVIPYFQVKVIAHGDTEAALTFGLRF
jgi:hypothetical protein